MMRWIGIVVVLAILVSCSFVPDAAPTAEIMPSAAATAETDDWVRLEAQGVELAIRTPHGWEAIADDYGILLAEHADLVEAGQPDGVLIYIFVPAMDDFATPAAGDTNHAWAVLKQVTERPGYIGDSTVSEPVPFTWGAHHAAYYLLSNEDDNRTMVLAVALPDSNKVIVCNVSTPAKDAHRIRDTLPTVLAHLTVNGVQLDSDALNALPDPLHFPQYHSEAEMTPEATGEPG